MKQLKERMGENIAYTDFEAYLDEYINKELPVKSKTDVAKDYQDFKEYYFMFNDDRPREQAFIDKTKS